MLQEPQTRLIMFAGSSDQPSLIHLLRQNRVHFACILFILLCRSCWGDIQARQGGTSTALGRKAALQESHDCGKQHLSDHGCNV
jgi:hypothetical protein